MAREAKPKALPRTAARADRFIYFINHTVYIH